MRTIALLVLIAACGTAKPGGMSGPTMNNTMGGAAATPEVSPVVSQDILAREPISNRAVVKHILIAWKDLDSEDYHVDPRAQGRTKHDAEQVVKSLLGQLHAGADFDQLMSASSEDLGSASTGQPFTVTPDAGLVIEFKQLGLRLNVGEIGVCESPYGFHIMKRVE